MTTREPGASEVLTQGLVARPRSTACLRQQAGGHQHLGVGGVGAAGDGGDDHVAVGAARGRRPRGLRASPPGRRRLTRGSRPRASRKARPAPAQRHPVLGPGRAGQARLHGGRGRARPSRSRPARPPRRLVPEALLLGVGLDQREVVLVPPGEAQVVDRGPVDREDGAGGPVLGRHVADGGPGLDRHRGHARAVGLDELAHHAVAAQQLGDGEHQVGGGGALGQLAERGGGRPPGGAAWRGAGRAWPPRPRCRRRPSRARRGRSPWWCGSRCPTRVSQYARPSGVAKTTRARCSRFTWWQMPVPGGTTRKPSKEPCAHRRSW